MTTTPATTPTAPPAWLRRWPLAGHRPGWLASAVLHLLLDLPFAILGATLTVTFGAVSFGLLPIYPVALAMLVVWLGLVHGGAMFERGRISALLGVRVAPPPGLPDDLAWHARLWAAVRNPTTWRAQAYQLARLPVVVLTFTMAVVAISLPLALLMMPLGLLGAQLPLVPTLTWLLALASPALGLALLPLAAQTVHALAMLDVSLAARLLGRSASDEREERIQRLHATRSEMVDIAEQERRRIERDLHDGAGQQLVSLAMTLGMAREKLATDPDRAQALLDEAHAEAKEALVGLRDIVRGISPAILNDRGLGAALAAVAGRSGVPVALEVEVKERPDAVTEGIAYYLVCEAIGNAIRHADATEIRVRLARHDQVLEVEITDDGRGGADPTRGTGLRGLAGRVAAVDGELFLDSPTGGGTTLRATLPIRPSVPATSAASEVSSTTDAHDDATSTTAPHDDATSATDPHDDATSAER